MARRTRQISLKECYDILRLRKGASLQDVKTAYRRRAFELHPDLNPGNPEAGRQFQLLNEAYVALSAMLKANEDAKAKAAATAEKKEKERHERPERPEAEGDGAEAGAKTESKESADSRATQAQAAYAEQDVLRDVLNDPFARRVFEDIYRELNRSRGDQTRESAQTTQGRPTRSAPPRKEPETASAVPPLDRVPEKGVKGMFKDLLRRQLDDEQSIRMPASRLGPGCKIRLRIRKSMSDELSEVDVRLPPDFVVGKPMRLRGLGKKVGPWQGDLYLTIYSQ